MSQDLGARLLRAGLLTRGQLTDAIAASGGPDAVSLLHALVAQGMPEDALAGFFLSMGFGPLVEQNDLQRAEPSLLTRLGADTAQALLALPLHTEPDGIAVAMADPTDTHAIETASRALDARLLPRVARVRELSDALEQRGSVHDARTVVRDMSAELAQMNTSHSSEDETAVAAIRKRPVSFAPDDDNETTAVGKHPALEMLAEHDEVAVPLVRQKPVSSPARAQSSLPPGETWSDAPATGADSWTDGLTLPGRPPSLAPAMTVVPTGSIAPQDALETEPSGKAPMDIAHWLDGLSTSSGRDEAVRIACDAAMTVGRAVVFFSVKKDSIQGREVRGESVSQDVVRSLTIPISSPSSLRNAAIDGVPYQGPLGASAAESLYSAVIGRRGGSILFQPVVLGGKPVGLLCVDGLRFDDAGRAQVAMICDALAVALSRIIKSGKK